MKANCWKCKQCKQCRPIILIYRNQTITAERSLTLRIFLSSPLSGPIPLIVQSILCTSHSQSKGDLQLCASQCYQSGPCEFAQKAGCWAVSPSLWILSLTHSGSHSLWEIHSLQRSTSLSHTRCSLYFLFFFYSQKWGDKLSLCPRLSGTYDYKCYINVSMHQFIFLWFNYISG